MMRDGKKGIPDTGQSIVVGHNKPDWFEYMCSSLMSVVHVMVSPLNSPLAAGAKSSFQPAELNCLLPLSKGLSFPSQ